MTLCIFLDINHYDALDISYRRVMKDFQDHLVRVAHVPERNAPYYAGWVRQAQDLSV
ncbi:MAG: hypothetical protein O3A47_06005 [Chloroflexi bacterium]|nr:hypothetical protein [Chloroflexota bacterium]